MANQLYSPITHANSGLNRCDRDSDYLDRLPIDHLNLSADLVTVM
jgi:hypothetical protein